MRGIHAALMSRNRAHGAHNKANYLGELYEIRAMFIGRNNIGSAYVDPRKCELCGCAGWCGYYKKWNRRSDSLYAVPWSKW